MRLRPAVLALALAAAPAAAAEPLVAGPAGAAGAVTGAGLLAGWQRADGAQVAAVEIRLAPGWHTYWRVPGEAGIPPRFDWSGSGNLAAVAYEWPRPEVFESYGLRTFGYADVLVLPVVLTPERPGEPIEAAVEVSFGVCEDICVPAEVSLAARLVPDGPAPDRARIEAALADRPLAPAEAGVARVTCGLAAGARGPELTAEVTFAADPGPGQLAVLEAGRPGLAIGLPESRTEGRRLVARAWLDGPAPAIDRSELRITVLDARRAVDIRGCEAPG